MLRVYAIGVGGSGSKCIESLVFLHSIGLLGNARLGVVLVDADASNGNSQRAQANLRRCADCQNLFGKGSTAFMEGEFHDYGIWNPLADVIHCNNLGQVFNRTSMASTSPQLAYLFDALFSPDEQIADLNVGFRGRPPIGSAVMSRLELKDITTGKDTLWGRVFDDIATDVSNHDPVVVHLFGSVFGGTGASGVPTLAKLIHEQLEMTGNRKNVHINATPLLPYFGFSKPDDGDQTVFAETRFFGLNTQAALQYFTEQSPGVFDTVYLLGNSEKELYDTHTGGTNQQNNAHFIELIAALSVADGVNRPIGTTQAAYISRSEPDRLNWDDLPSGSENRSPREYLGRGVRFAYAWFYNVSLELDAAKVAGSKHFAKGAPWFPRFFRLNSSGTTEKPSVKDEQETIRAAALDDWAKAFLTWVKQLGKGTSTSQAEQLFKLKRLGEIQDKRGYEDSLAELIIDGPISPVDVRRDCIDRVKNQLADRMRYSETGTFGLSHALFENCMKRGL